MVDLNLENSNKNKLSCLTDAIFPCIYPVYVNAVEETEREIIIIIVEERKNT